MRYLNDIDHVPDIIECDLLVSVGQMDVVFVLVGDSQRTGRLCVVLIGNAGGVGVENSL